MKPYITLLALVVTIARVGLADIKETDNVWEVFGVPENPQTVNASELMRKLESGKDVSLEYVRVDGDIKFGREIKQDVHFANTTFSGTVNFSHAVFSAEAVFRHSTFSTSANFNYTIFSGKADFSHAIFSGRTNFQNADFSGEAYFSWCQFEEESDFRCCFYPEHTEVHFDNVTGFSRMLNQWQYDDYYNPETDSKLDLSKVKRRGLKGHLAYNRTFYIALVRNYQDLGWWCTLDTYYTYRQELRRSRLKAASSFWKREYDRQKDPVWFRQRFTMKAKLFYMIKQLVITGLEYFGLEITFGYGVKALRLFRTFVLFWIPFALFYIGFMKHENDYRVLGWRAWNPFRYRTRCLWWALLHSLDTISPGINLHSAKSLEKGPYRFNVDSKAVVCVERAQQILGWYLLAMFIYLFGTLSLRTGG